MARSATSGRSTAPWWDALWTSFHADAAADRERQRCTGTPRSASRLAALAARGDPPCPDPHRSSPGGLAHWAAFPRDRIVGHRPLPSRSRIRPQGAGSNPFPPLRPFRTAAADPEQQAAVERARAFTGSGFELLDTRYTTDVPAAVLSPPEAVLTWVLRRASNFCFEWWPPKPQHRPGPRRCVASRNSPPKTSPAARFTFEGPRVDVEVPGKAGAKEEPPKAGRRAATGGRGVQEPCGWRDPGFVRCWNPAMPVGQTAGKLTGGSIAEQQAAYAPARRSETDAADALLVESLDRPAKREVANEVM